MLSTLVVALCLLRPAESAVALDGENRAVVRITTNLGLGSGFLVRADGIILTAYHVIAGAKSAWVYFPGGSTGEARVVAVWPRADIAMLKVDPAIFAPNTAPIRLSADRAHPAGTKLTAVGYPGDEGQQNFPGELYVAFDQAAELQMSSAVRRGCSGGPVLNANGEAIGVTIAVHDPRDPVGIASVMDWNTVMQAADNKPMPLADSESIGDVFGRAVQVMEFWLDRAARHEDASGMKAAMAWALPQFSKVMKEWPDSARPRLLAGLCSLSVGESDKAHSFLKEAVRLDPKSIAAHSALASVLRLTEVRAALDEAQRVVEVAPRYSTGHVDVGRTLLSMGRKREAIEELRRAVRLKPENLEAQIGLGVAYRRVKQYTQSIEAFRTALAFKSNCARAHYGLCLTYQALGDKKSSDRELFLLKEIDPSLVPALKLDLAKGETP